MGNTGNSDGAHLHLGILTNTNGTSDIDPLPYLMNEKSLLEEPKPEPAPSGETTYVVQKVILYGLLLNISTEMEINILL